jgi:cathepsin A (carboxypeptidase C)
MQLFLTQFPKYATLDFHVTGESYAGHYIPAIAKVISEENAGLDHDALALRINLKSLMIGNGLTDPLNQYDSYPDMACESNCSFTISPP